MVFRFWRQRGAVTIMVALTMLVLLALAGLVVDGAIAYLVKARLNAAVDSAALAAARAVSKGSSRDAQESSAKTAAANFFAANIPATYIFSKPKLLGTDVTFANGEVRIDVRAEAPMPVSLMRVLGFTSLTPAASAQTIRKDLDMALVIDTSGSLKGSAAAVKASATSFLNKFNAAEDRVGLIHFATGAEVDSPIKLSGRGFDRSTMLKEINSYNFDGFTAAVEGMWQARSQLNAIPTASRSTLRVIVFFSDGVPTAFGTKLNFKAPALCTSPGVLDKDGGGLYALDDSTGVEIPGCSTYDYDSANKKLTVHYDETLPDFYTAHGGSTDVSIVTEKKRKKFERFVVKKITMSNYDVMFSGAARNLAEAVAIKAQEEGIYVFTLGMGAQLKVEDNRFNNETGEDILKCMANVPDGPSRCHDKTRPVGMYCYAATEADLTPCFTRLASGILRISK